MEVTQIAAHGLRREFKVVLPAADLASRLEGELAGLKDKVRINGFRPGKVPLAHLKRLYGRSVMGEIVQNAVNEANRKIVEDNGLRLALEPKVDLVSDQGEVERAMEAKGDLAFTVAVETVPTFETGTFDDLDLERPVAEVSPEDVDKALNRMANETRNYEPKTTEDARVEQGDRVTVDFRGTIDGEPFEGGTGENIEVVVGSDSFIPGFEGQLVGAQVGETRTVSVTFPENYAAPALAGRPAVFEVKVKTIAAPGELAFDDAFANTFGLDTLEALREAIREQIAQEASRASRDRLKRTLLDALDKRYAFDLPEGLVGQEFANIWGRLEAEQKRVGRTFADEGTTEEQARAEYRRIAERRVRLGLVLAEVGERGGIKVEDEEVGRAIAEVARQFPGREHQIWDYYRKNPQALTNLKAPLFEDKVVDLIVSQARVTDRVVARDELFRPLEDEDDLSPSSSANAEPTEQELVAAASESSEEEPAGAGAAGDEGAGEPADARP